MVERNKTFQVVVHGIMVLLCLVCVLPFLLLIMSSVADENWLIMNGYSFFPAKLSADAYQYLLVDSSSIVRGYLISAFVTVAGTCISLVMTTLMAYPLSRKDLPGRYIFSFFNFFTMLLNGGLVPTYIMWTQTFHIKNTIFALLVPNLLMGAFYVIMMRTYFSSNIPDAVIEAARIDGAGEMRILLKIVLPMSLPIIATLALLTGLGYWNDWLNGLYYIQNDSLYSIQVLLNRMLMDVQFLMSSANTAAAGNQQMGPLPSTGIKMAVAVLGALPALIIYPFFQKYFVKGITIGAVKG